jgi:hypothetical protein
MTTDQILILMYSYINSNYKDPTTLIVEREEYENFVKETSGILTYVSPTWTENKITLMGCTLRVIFATNLEEGEVIVL